MSIIKVCVRIPSERKEDLLAVAEDWRTSDLEIGDKGPGWDAKAIHKIAREEYGNLATMFNKHNWPETGSDMMRNVQRHVKETYGSVEKFQKAHE